MPERILNMRNKVSLQKVSVLYQGTYIRLVKKNDWEYIQRHNCTGIVIIVSMTNDKRVVLTEQFRPPVGKRVIEFPAGLMNDKPGVKKESVAASARRELFEETGYRAGGIKNLMTGPVSGGSSMDLVSMVLAYGLTKEGKGGGDETEQIKVHEVPLKEIDRWLAAQGKKGKLIEPKIYSGLYFLNKYNGLFKPL